MHIAAQYGILKGGLGQGTSMFFHPPESLKGREAGVNSEDLLSRLHPEPGLPSVMSRMT